MFFFNQNCLCDPPYPKKNFSGTRFSESPQFYGSEYFEFWSTLNWGRGGDEVSLPMESCVLLQASADMQNKVAVHF